MDELKLLIDMVANLPSMALWVLAGFFAYKVCIIGSIYGVIRLAIIKMHDWLTHPKTVQFKFDGITVNEEVAAHLRAQIARVVDGSYMHVSDVMKLKNAIDLMKSQEKK